MSQHACETCNGVGTVCSYCGKGRARRAGKDGTGSHYMHRRSKVVPCPKHTETFQRCDVCGVEELGHWRDSRIRLASIDPRLKALGSICPDCEKAASEAISVVLDDVMQRRSGLLKGQFLPNRAQHPNDR